MKEYLKKGAAVTLSFAMLLSLTACGGKETGDNGQGGSGSGAADVKEWVYVPEFLALEDENASYYDMKLAGDCLYYSTHQWDEATGTSGQSIVKYSLTDRSATEFPLSIGEMQSLNYYAVAEDGSICAVVYDYSDDTPGPEGYPESKSLLCRYDASGAEVFSQDLTQTLKKDGETSYVQGIVLDGQGRIYVTADSQIFLFDAQGNYQGEVAAGGDSWINSAGCGKDGNVYISYYSYDGSSSSYVLARVDYDSKSVGETYKGFISGNSQSLSAGADSDFVVQDGTSVYAYDMKTQSAEKLFDWLDSDINGGYVTCVGATSDGKILAVVNDWENGDNSVALLTKTKASEVAQKETILVGTLSSGSDLQAAAVRFNKSNDKYHISIREYLDFTNGWNENTWTDAITNLNNDITSDNCPDIIDLTNVNIKQFAAKGVFEDLTPYLEASTRLNREDLLENILEAYTFDGVLVSIPGSFELQTVVGRTSEVGTGKGWTLEELVAFADAHPGAELFDKYPQEYMMQLCMMYNEDAFIDWSTGKCSFDSPEFKSLLEFVNRFPVEVNYEEGQASTPTRIQNGEVLLDMAYIYDFDEIQLYNEIFGGEAACIGFPTADGSSGTALMASQAFSITSKSDAKDGAWEFIENFLTQDSDNSDRWGFPNNKTKLAAMAEEAVKVEYVTDENGAVVKDENGEPIVMNAGSGVGYEDGWEYTYRIPTQEEVDMVMELMESAQPVSTGNDEVINIITEEAAAYFKGQKSVDDVANIIQSRVNIYVSENS